LGTTVLTLKDLAANAEFGVVAVAGGAHDVDRALILSSVEWIGAKIERALIVTDRGVARPDHLVRTLAAGGAAGLALAGTTPDDPLVAELSKTAAAHRLPLLTSTRTLAEWRELAPRVADLGTDLVRRQHARLAALLDHLPAPDTDEHTTVRRLTAFLARQLDADVLVNSDTGVLAATPTTAPVVLAPVLGVRTTSAQVTPQGRYAQTVPLTGDGAATLVLATREPVGAAEQGLVAYTAKALTLALAGLREQHSARAVGDAIRGVRLSAFQLLMTGNAVPAQRVMAGISHGLLDSDTARVYIVDCNRASRDAVMAEAERALLDQALMVRCPAYRHHVIVVAPQHPDKDPEKRLHQLLETFSEDRVLLGGSLAHPMDEVSDAYGEALDSLTRAGYSPDRVAMATRTTGIIDVLPPDAARAWASQLLRPVLMLPRGGQQVLETTAMALEFEISAAARIIGVHRNTVTRRVRQVFDEVGLDHDRIMHRVVLSLAAQIVGRYGGDLDAAPGPAPDLHELLAGPALAAWAVKALSPLADDRRGLLRTVRAWICNDCRVESTAVELGIATKTVRSHIRAAEPLLERDLITGLPKEAPDESEHRLASIRPLAVALYATTPPGTTPPPLPGGAPRRAA
jgi:hypothetical protein